MDRPDRRTPGALGVGLVHWPELAPVFEVGTDVVQVVELEPQTLWSPVDHGGRRRYRVDEEALDRVAALSQRALVHGVGQPVGGTVPDPLPYAEPLRHCIDVLDPPWVSEHLSFSRHSAGGRVRDAGFLLPPSQTPAAVRVAATNLTNHQEVTGRPVAFETGVNYLRPDATELADGAFFADVAEASGCGILVDLHNLWCNERNGRGRVVDVLAALPPERIWEIHLSGGAPAGGYWLDAHRGLVPPEVIDHAADLIPQLPNLGAVVVEIMPDSALDVGLDAVVGQLADVGRLWSLRPPVTISPSVARRGVAASDDDLAQVARREGELVRAIHGGAGAAGDPGVALYRELIGDARRGALATGMRYTMTALLVGAGRRATAELVDAYLDTHPPAAYPAVESDGFATFLLRRSGRLPPIPYLDEVLAFEHAVIRAGLYDTETTIHWSGDPTSILEALDAGRLPEGLAALAGSIRVAPTGA